MKKIMYATFPMLLYLAISSAVLITGGVNTVFAEAYFPERFIYQILAENNISRVRTVFQVYAPNEREARENVAGNGWRILEIRQITYRQSTPVPLYALEGPVSTGVVGSESSSATPGYSSGMSDEDLINSLLGTPSVEPPLPIPERPGRGDGLAVMSPDSDNLELLFTIYFNLGETVPQMSYEYRRHIEALPKDGEYYLFGHTDSVSVQSNTQFSDNFDLSFKRAEAVKEILIEYGINSANVSSVGLGSLYPVVENVSPSSGTVQNRRVEIYGLRKTE